MCDVLMQPVRTPRPSTNLRSKPLRPTGDGGVFPRLGRLIVRRPWVVIAFWVALAGLLAPTVPSLDAISQRHPVAILPSDAPVLVSTRQMTAAFREAGLQSVAVVVLSDAKGLGAADERSYKELVDALRRDTRDVVMLQDFVTTPPLRELMTSKDNQAWILPVGLPGDLGSTQSKQAYARVADIVEHQVAGSTLTANLTGPAATVADLNLTGQRDRSRIEFAITILLLVILLIIYGNPITMVLPLITIGMSVVVAQRLVAIAGLAGLGIANQSIIFMSGMMVGAGTDYAVFLISRYHDYLRQGADSDQAVKKALTSIGKVIAASAATVAMASKLGDVRAQVNRAISTVGGLIDALAYLQDLLGGNRVLGELEGAEKLIGSMRALGDTIDADASFVANNTEWASPVLGALDSSPMCTADPACASARTELQRLVTARDDGTLAKISELARQLQATRAVQTLAATVSGLRGALATVIRAMGSLGMSSPGGVRSKINLVNKGVNDLADGSRQLAEGVQLLVDQVKKMGFGLGEASAFLLAMKDTATTPAMAGFYIPPELLSYATGESVKAETMPSEYRDLLGGLNVDQLKKVAAAFISPDGHSIRYLIQTDLNPFSTAAMDQIDAITAAARGAQPNTALADAKVSVVGLPVVLKDTRDYSDHDLRLIIAMTVCIVLLILIVLLRAIVAPLYLIGSVIVSYLAALGIGVIVFQFLLGQEMHWSIPGLTFVILVAVGADYNMLLISRLREEAVLGVRSGVIRTVASTGGVITAAGLIMAASMYGLVFASLGSVVQGAFVLGTGLLLDTFLVRTVTVPAIAVLVGQANWWLPSSWRPATWWPLGRRRGRAQRTKRKPLLPKEEEEQSPPDDDDLIGLWLHDGLRL